jgi:hypothetical protein
MTNKEMFREFRAAFLWSLGVLTLSSLIIIVVFPGEPQPSKAPESKFRVVDHYQGCDVIQYTRTSLSNYIYFLDCR